MNDFRMFENLFTSSTKIHQRNKSFVVKDINSDGLFEKTQETFLDEEGPKTEEKHTIHQADCGHLVGLHNPSELKGVCGKCGRSLCHNCAFLRCRRCLSILCDTCAKVVDGAEVYCSKCRVFHFSKRFSLFGLLGLHKLLSKEIQ